MRPRHERARAMTREKEIAPSFAMCIFVSVNGIAGRDQEQG
jgi:hypothetical protein